MNIEPKQRARRAAVEFQFLYVFRYFQYEKDMKDY